MSQKMQVLFELIFPSKKYGPIKLSFERRKRRWPRIKRQHRRVMVIERNDPRVDLVVLAMVNLNPHIPLRQIEVQFGIPKSTAQRILALHNVFPYHITLIQSLMPTDFQWRLEFCNYCRFKQCYVIQNFLDMSYFIIYCVELWLNFHVAFVSSHNHFFPKLLFVSLEIWKYDDISRMSNIRIEQNSKFM